MTRGPCGVVVVVMCKLSELQMSEKMKAVAVEVESREGAAATG